MTEIKSPSIIRQEWIETAVKMFREHFSANWQTVPDNIRLSVGFPVGAKDGKRILGQCFPMEFSKDQHWEIFISPNYVDSVEILETIAHEMVHATVKEPGHRGKFKQCALAIGFEAPMTATPAGPKMLEFINKIIEAIGKFPAGDLNLMKRKKQATNLKKCECPDCGYIARVTMKWIKKVGEPICPVDEVQMICDDGNDEE